MISSVDFYKQTRLIPQPELKSWCCVSILELCDDYGQEEAKEWIESLADRIIEMAIRDRIMLCKVRDAFDDLRADMPYYRKVCFANFYTAYKKKRR